MTTPSSLLLFALAGILCPESALGFGKYLQQKSLAKEGEEEGEEEGDNGAAASVVVVAEQQQVQTNRPVAFVWQAHSPVQTLDGANSIFICRKKKLWQAMRFSERSFALAIMKWGAPL